MGGTRQTFSCLSKLRETTNFNTVPLWPSLVSILNVLADFRKFDNFSRLFYDISGKNCRSGIPKMEKMRVNKISI